MKQSVDRPPESPRPQFSIKGMLIFTSGTCILFAILAAIGIPVWQLLVGLVVMSVASLLAIFAAEAAVSLETRDDAAHVEARWRQMRSMMEAKRLTQHLPAHDSDDPANSGRAQLDRGTSPFASKSPAPDDEQQTS